MTTGAAMARPGLGSLVRVCVVRTYGAVVTTLRVTEGVVWHPPWSLWLVGEELLANGTWSARSVVAELSSIVVVEPGGGS